MMNVSPVTIEDSPQQATGGISMQGTFIFIFALLTLQQASGNTLAIHLARLNSSGNRQRQWPSLFPSHAKYRDVSDAFHVDYIYIMQLQFILKLFKVKFAPSGVISEGPDKDIS